MSQVFVQQHDLHLWLVPDASGCLGSFGIVFSTLSAQCFHWCCLSKAPSFGATWCWKRISAALIPSRFLTCSPVPPPAKPGRIAFVLEGLDRGAAVLHVHRNGSDRQLQPRLDGVQGLQQNHFVRDGCTLRGSNLPTVSAASSLFWIRTPLAPADLNI